jgi:outer membrane murein-binding lipoprotein Lpp
MTNDNDRRAEIERALGLSNPLDYKDWIAGLLRWCLSRIAALEAERDALRAQVEAARAEGIRDGMERAAVMAQNLARSYDTGPNHGGPTGTLWRQIREAIAALPAPEAERGGDRLASGLERLDM